MYAFGLVETNFYSEAEKHALLVKQIILFSNLIAQHL